MQWVCGDELSKKGISAKDYTVYENHLKKRMPVYLKPKRISMEKMKPQESVNSSHENKILAINYIKLLEDLKRKKMRFVDKDFPISKISKTEQMVSINSIYKNSELLPQKLIAEEILTHQNEFANKNLLCVLSILAKKRLDTLFPIKQLNEQGLYIVKLSINGLQEMVVVDDLIPVTKNKNSQYNQLHIINSKAFKYLGKQFIYPIILEKALAKILGGYNKLDFQYDYLEYLLPGLIDVKYLFNDKQTYEQIWDIIRDTLNKKGLLISKTKMDYEIKNYGLDRNRYYQIFVAQEINYKQEKIKILGFNYFGNWKGPFSNSDPEWSNIPKQDKFKLKFVQSCPSTFYMRYEDFFNFFLQLKIEDFQKQYHFAFENNRTPNNPLFLSIFSKEPASILLRIQPQYRNANSKKLNIKNYILLSKIIMNYDCHYVDGLYSEDNLVTMRFSIPANIEHVFHIERFEIENLQNVNFRIILSSNVKLSTTLISPINNFLNNLFFNHSLIENKPRHILINQSPSELVSEYFFYKKGGYGYFSVYIDQHSKNKIVVNLRKNNVILGGLVLLNDMQYEIEKNWVVSGNLPLLLIFRIDQNYKENLIKFPPEIELKRLMYLI